MSAGLDPVSAAIAAGQSAASPPTPVDPLQAALAAGAGAPRRAAPQPDPIQAAIDAGRQANTVSVHSKPEMEMPPQGWRQPGSTVDVQRNATPWERFMNGLATINYGEAGATRAALAHQNPIKGAMEGIQGHTTFGDVLREQLPGGLPPGSVVPGQPELSKVIGEAAIPAAGLSLDVGLDPITWLSAGETAIGKFAQARRVEEVLNALREGRPMAQAAAEGPSLAERARQGEVGLLNFAGKRVVPLPSPVAAAIEAGQKVGSAAFGKTFNTVPYLKGPLAEAFRSQRGDVGAAGEYRWNRVTEALKPQAEALQNIADKHGLDPDAVARAVSDAVETSRPVRYAGETGPKRVGETPTATLGEILGQPQEAPVRKVLGPIAEPTPEQREAQLTKAVSDASSMFGPAREDLEQPIRESILKINALNTQELLNNQRAGIPISELTDQFQYLGHITRPEAADAIAKASPEIGDWLKGKREITDNLRAAMKRDMRGKTLVAINDLTRAGEMTINGHPIPALPNGLFYENPFVVTAMRARAGARAEESANMLRRFAATFGEQPQMTQYGAARNEFLAEHPGWMQVPTSIKDLKDYYFPPDIARQLAAHTELASNPGPFLRAFDRAQGIWKAYTLGIFPVYHTRNTIGHAWNLIPLAGLGHGLNDGGALALRRWATGAHIEMEGREGKTILNLGDRTAPGVPTQMTTGELRDLGERKGIYFGNANSDAWRELSENGTGGNKVMQAIEHNKALDVAHKVGAFRDNAGRSALFMDRLMKGDSPELAALYVKKYLFDYGDLTGREKAVFRRLIPFWSFMRKNVPLQLAGLMEHPGAYAGYEKARNEMGGEEGLGIGSTPLPQYLRETTPTRVGTSKEGFPEFQRGEGVLTAADLDYVMNPQRAVEHLGESLTPFAKVPYEMLANRSMLTGEPLDRTVERIPPAARNVGNEFPGETENYLGLPTSRRWAEPALEEVRVLQELNRANPGGIFGTQKRGPIWNPAGAPRPHPDPDALARVTNLLFSRIYAVNPEEEQRSYEMNTERAERDLQRQLEGYLRKGDRGNAMRVQTILNQLAAGGR